MNSPLDLGGLTVRELAKRVWAEISDDNVWDAAAQLGYYFVLALFPLLIFLLSLVATLPTHDVVGPFMATLKSVMPGQAYELVQSEIDRILHSSGGGLLTFGMLGTVWAASSGVVSLVGTLNRAYEADETRGMIKLRAIALALTFALAALLISGSVLLVMGDNIADWASAALGLAAVGKVVGVVVNYALGFAILFLALEVLYYFGPNVTNQKWTWVSPGSVVGVALFVLSSVGFSLYVKFNDSYSVTYGSLGAVIVLLLWLYLLGFSILLGAEINSEIAKAADARGEEEAPEPRVPAPSGDTGKADSSAEKKTETGTKRAAAPQAPEANGEREPKPAVAAAPVAKPSAVAETGLAEISADRGATAERLALRDLLKALEHANAGVRAAAAAALGNMRSEAPEAAAALAGRLSDDDERVREAAQLAMERIGRAA